MQDFKRTKKTRVRRAPQRGRYDRATVHAILDEGLVCHIGIVEDGDPVVIPTAYWRRDEYIYFHGSTKSRLIMAAQSAKEICITVTLLDGLVMARSGMHHSMNYRSVVAFGRAETITGEEARLAALRCFIERFAPGRWDEMRLPTKQEMKATQILRLELERVSAKARSGPPIDDDEDYAAAVWAGELPLSLAWGEPVPDPKLRPGIEMPDSLPGAG